MHAAAISSSALQQVKLKVTDDTSRKDRSAPNLSLVEAASKEKEETRRRYFFATGLDRWYLSLKDKTFRSEFVEITPNEARAIVSYWENNFQHKSSHDTVPNETAIAIPELLRDLSDRISAMISSISPHKGAFVKLSTRSPKDSHVAFAKAREAYTARSHTTVGPNASPNDKLILLAEVVIESLRVRNGCEAIKLLLSSDRVGEDLEYALEPGDQDFAKRICLVIREWVEIPLWAEFRGFVWGGKLTSIGQYNHPVMFPQLKVQALSIKADLESFFATVKDQIPLDRYIIDFAWTKDQVYLVEVNPFDGEIVFPASTGLWSWDKDRDQMMNGPLEIRIREDEQNPDTLKSTLDPQWRAIVFS